MAKTTGLQFVGVREFKEKLTGFLARKHEVVVCRNPIDDAYLSLCAGVMADILVTGDKDLLAVDPAVTQGLPSNLKIITPRQFLELEY